MNNERRKEINNIKALLFFENGLEEALDRLEQVLYEEENSYYSIPENLLGSKRAENSEDAIDYLSKAIEILSNYIDNNKRNQNHWKRISNNVRSELIKIH